MKPLKIQVASPDMHHSPSFYRGLGPLNELARKQLIQHACINTVDWTITPQFDWMFFLRPWQPEHLEAVKYAKMVGVKVWIDYDDNMLAIPPHNEFFEWFSSDRIRKAIMGCLQEADLITTSTHHLAAYYEKASKRKVQVIPNAFNNSVFTFYSHPKLTNRIVWRGSKTHAHDMTDVDLDIFNLQKKFPEHEWCFIGMFPWMLGGTKNMFHEAVHVVRLPQLLNKTAAKVAIVPLSESPFNRAKSNCAWLEFTQAGTPVVAPDWEEWRKPGITTYTPHILGSFEKAVASVLEASPKKCRMLVEESRDYINEHLLLSKVNEERLNALL